MHMRRALKMKKKTLPFIMSTEFSGVGSQVLSTFCYFFEHNNFQHANSDSIQHEIAT